jgi:hypothetical protein
MEEHKINPSHYLDVKNIINEIRDMSLNKKMSKEELVSELAIKYAPELSKKIVEEKMPEMLSGVSD